ncbi:MAG TPA: hypothetical protein DD414_11265 [Lachnospiraceae bacterium]|nr:hypothetical protein [Lachnospiraceae bacterium]
MKKRILALLLALSMTSGTAVPVSAAQPAREEQTPVTEETEVGLPEKDTGEIKPETGDDTESTKQPEAGGDTEGAEQPGTGADTEDTEQLGSEEDAESTDRPGAGGDAEAGNQSGTGGGGEDAAGAGTGDDAENRNQPEQEDVSGDLIPEYTEEASHELPFEIGGTDIFAGADMPAGYAIDGASVNDVKYDPRGLPEITPVKRQSPWGTCWAFATMAVLENSMIRQGFADSMNLSVRHLAYFAFHTGLDVLGNASGDTVVSSPANTYLKMGGNAYMSAVKLMNWHGAANEASYPYSSTMPADLAPGDAQSSEVMAHDLYFIPTKGVDRQDKVRAIKEAILRYGCVGWSYKSEDDYYNNATNAYYYPNGEGTNHAITVVGWDDVYPRTNFKAGYRPSEDGAWIVKNSWGSSWGDNGYFYISYEDSTLGSGNAAFVAVAARRIDYDNNYFYGNSVNARDTQLRSGRKAAHVFQVKAGEDREKVKAVSMMLYSEKAEYSIQIYKNPIQVDGVVKDPESGQPMLAEPVTGQTGYAGLYTIDLPKPVYFSKGDVMSVVVSFPSAATLYADANSGVKTYMSKDGTFTIESINATLPGQTFYSNSTGSTIWYDEYDSHKTSRINILTQNTTDRIVKFLDLEGNLLSEQEVSKGNSAVPPEVPERTGYVFKGWSGSYTNITDDIELTPEYEPVTYTITYHLDGGTNASENPASYTIESDAVLLSDPEREGYIFAGWYSQSGFTDDGVFQVAGGETGDLTLYARWIEDNGKVITPVFVPRRAILEEGQSVVIKANKGAEIYYTLDGTKPSKSKGARYTGPIELTKDTTVKAIAVLNGEESQTAEISYKYYLMHLVLADTEKNVFPGETLSLEVIKLPTTKNKNDIIWESLDENVATVSSAGEVTGVGLGAATILARTLDYKGNPVTAECRIHVVRGGRDKELIWTLDEQGLFTLSGRGDLSPDSNGRNVIPWKNCLSEIKSVRVSVTDMTNAGDLFSYCRNLLSVDLTELDAKRLSKAIYMFYECNSLETLDLSMIDGSITTSMTGIVTGCTNLKTVYTPCNMEKSVSLPEGTWYQMDGSEVTEFPKNLEYSTILTRNKAPDLSGFRLEVKKEKTVYECGDTLDLDDLTVLLYDEKNAERKVSGYGTNAGAIDMDQPGTKTLTITFNVLKAQIKILVTAEAGEPTGWYNIFFDLGGHGPDREPLAEIKEGSLLEEPEAPEAEGYRFTGWYKDSSCTALWDFDSDIVEADMTLYAGWLAESGAEDGLYVQEIRPQIYTGSALKPPVFVYADDSAAPLTLKKDYTVKYYNNINADQTGAKGGVSRSGQEGDGGFTKELAYAVITGKGNYKGQIYLNFHIKPVSLSDAGGKLAQGFTLKYTSQVATDLQAQKPFGSLKYRKSMKLGKDFSLAIENADGKVISSKGSPSIGKGSKGVYKLKITGLGNYQGTAEKEVYATDEKHLLKNVTVAVGEKIKSMPYTGSAVRLLPGYPAKDGNYYSVGTDKSVRKASQDSIFMVWSEEKYLIYGTDFEIRYKSNRSVGTATMTLVGIGAYAGTKDVKFRITGTAFNSKKITVENFRNETDYTGKPVRQNVTLKISGKKLDYGADYTISYKNNLKKGTATVIFTARPASGCTGSFKKTFKIKAADLSQTVRLTAADASDGSIRTASDGRRFDGKVYYTKNGAKLSGRFLLTGIQTGDVLQEGKDYTVSYSNNKAVTTNAVMIIKGKGNYTGSLKIYYQISETPLDTLSVTVAPAYYSPKNKEYHPAVRLKDQKAVLKEGKDYEIGDDSYKNCKQEEVRHYLDALKSGVPGKDLEKIRPYVIITAKEKSGYRNPKRNGFRVNLNIGEKKLSQNTLYVVVEEKEAVYTGNQVCPEAAVYYGDAKDVKAAAKAKETSARALTTTHKLIRLRMYENGAGDYTLTYGANRTAGKNKGSVTVTGRGLYGGSVTVKFTIVGKNL